MRRLPWLLILLGQAWWLAQAASKVVFNPASPEGGPFPTDYLTVPDTSQKTGLRVNLPFPDCVTYSSTCDEIARLNELDGFNPLPRVSVRFSTPINPDTVAEGVFLVWLDNLTSEEYGLGKKHDVMTINQVIYDPASYTAYAKPDGFLDQHRRYLLVATDAVHAVDGAPVEADPAFTACVTHPANDYCHKLAQALGALPAEIVQRHIVAASIFTTLSATAWLEKARATLPSMPLGFQRTGPKSVFDIARIALLTWHQQTAVNPAKFRDISFPLPATLVQGIGRMAFGSFRSPRFLDDWQSIATTPTAAEVSLPGPSEEIFFHAFLPDAKMPPGGYPVIIFGHGFGDSRLGGPSATAGSFARAGFATIAINAVGHGYGPDGTIRITETGGTVTELPGGGRGVDLNGDGLIDSSEGCLVSFPVPTAFRDCFRQTAVDLMQLVRLIRAGVDLDGDGVADLDPDKIYYVGQSLGSIYGTLVNAVEPDMRAATLNVGGGSVVDIARWSETYRTYAQSFLAQQHPYWMNAGNGFDDNYVLRYQPAKINTVWAGCDIQNFLERLEWLQSTGDPLSYAPHLRSSTLPGVPIKRVLFQYAKGDRSVPNPAGTALIRAANMHETTQFYRHDLARAVAKDLPLNPHPYLAGFLDLNSGTLNSTLSGLAIASAAQQQIAGFFASDGNLIPDANALVRLLFGKDIFETPAFLTEDLNY